MRHIRPYLRASTSEQDASRARQDLMRFIEERAPGRTPSAWYVENESGAKLQRPELFRLIEDASAGDIILIEQVDRLSRLTADDWRTLKAKLEEKRLRVVALDLPTSWDAMRDEAHGGPTADILDAVNRMMLDILAVVARKDYEDRRRRQAQGITKAKAEGKYQGRREDTERLESIRKMLERGMSWTDICTATKASRSTVAKVAQRLKTDALCATAEMSRG